MPRKNSLAFVFLLVLGTLALAQDITVENRDAIVPESAVPGLADYAGSAVGEIPNSLPSGLLEGLEIPDFRNYMGMTRDKVPESLRYHFTQVIRGVPGTKSLFDERYAIFSACRSGSCDEKGWFMIDIERQAYLGAIRHFFWGEEQWRKQGSLLLFSAHFETYRDIPAPYRQSLNGWTSDVVFRGDNSRDAQFAVVRFVNAGGNIESVCRDCTPQ